MNLPIFIWAKESPDVLALLKKGPLIRFWRFGEAPQEPERPYAVWQLIYGAPENKLAGIPDDDTYGIQFDAYSDKAADVRAIAEALRDAFEPHGYVIAWVGESREPDTRLYRFTFRMEFMTQRVVSS